MDCGVILRRRHSPFECDANVTAKVLVDRILSMKDKDNRCIAPSLQEQLYLIVIIGLDDDRIES